MTTQSYRVAHIGEHVHVAAWDEQAPQREFVMHRGSEEYHILASSRARAVELRSELESVGTAGRRVE